MRYLLLTAVACTAAFAAEPPSAEISNGVITAKFYLPNAETGYYRGTRFDWSGQIPSLRTKNHEYFGQWFEKYDPKLHDAIMGPVEEFRSAEGGIGYAEAKPGETFIRIGVGNVRKPEGEKEYRIFATYDIVDPGRWTVKPGKNSISFTHELTGANGYAYRYTKRVVLERGKPGMTIEHSLKNTGKKAIKTWQYNHNFFVMDQAPTGPDSLVEFPFELQATKPLAGEAGSVRGNQIVYSRELQMGESVYGEFAGAPEYGVRLENRQAGAGVQISGDRPIARIVYWSIRKTFCPEAYIDINVEPGKEFQWKYHYRFYDLANGGK